MKIYQLVLILSLFCGCGTTGTVTPDHVEDHVTVADSSVPAQYDIYKGGILFSIYNADGKRTHSVISNRLRDRYNTLIGMYRVRFKNETAETIKPDDGIEKFDDQFGNHVWKIDAQHLTWFAVLSQYEKDGLEQDGIWDKTKELLTRP